MFIINLNGNFAWSLGKLQVNVFVLLFGFEYFKVLFAFGC